MIKINLPKGKERCIYFDTEQSQYDVWKVVNRILTVAECVNPQTFEAYGLRTVSTGDRLFLIEQKIYSTEDLGLVVIDGVRDLINDINSPEEATMITSKLLKWTEERNIHIITVLHQNKGDNNARGHVGSEMGNKAETVASVEKDNDLSIVQPVYVRGKDFQPFAFSVDAAGMPYIIKEYVNGKQSDKKNKISPFDFPPDAHKKMLEIIFKDGRRLQYSDLIREISLVLQKHSISVGGNKHKEFQQHYSNSGWIKNSKEPGERYASWYLA